jgi:hypothetical protein
VTPSAAWRRGRVALVLGVVLLVPLAFVLVELDARRVWQRCQHPDFAFVETEARLRSEAWSGASTARAGGARCTTGGAVTSSTRTAARGRAAAAESRAGGRTGDVAQRHDEDGRARRRQRLNRRAGGCTGDGR